MKVDLKKILGVESIGFENSGKDILQLENEIDDLSSTIESLMETHNGLMMIADQIELNPGCESIKMTEIAIGLSLSHVGLGIENLRESGIDLNVSLESGIKETAKKIWDAIINAFRSIIEKIKSWFSGRKNDKKKNDEVIDEIKKSEYLDVKLKPEDLNKTIIFSNRFPAMLVYGLDNARDVIKNGLHNLKNSTRKVISSEMETIHSLFKEDMGELEGYMDKLAKLSDNDHNTVPEDLINSILEKKREFEQKLSLKGKGVEEMRYFQVLDNRDGRIHTSGGNIDANGAGHDDWAVDFREIDLRTLLDGVANLRSINQKALVNLPSLDVLDKLGGSLYMAQMISTPDSSKNDDRYRAMRVLSKFMMVRYTAVESLYTVAHRVENSEKTAIKMLKELESSAQRKHESESK